SRAYSFFDLPTLTCTASAWKKYLSLSRRICIRTIPIPIPDAPATTMNNNVGAILSRNFTGDLNSFLLRSMPRGRPGRTFSPNRPVFTMRHDMLVFRHILSLYKSNKLTLVVVIHFFYTTLGKRTKKRLVSRTNYRLWPSVVTNRRVRRYLPLCGSRTIGRYNRGRLLLTRIATTILLVAYRSQL